jgi:hypothetical protein
MTQKQFDDAVDEISQEQQQIDNQQNGVEAPSGLTEDRVRQMLDQQFQALRKEVSGLQSGWDRGLNAIRGDMRKELEDKFSEQYQVARKEQLLNSFEDPDRRKEIEMLLEYQEANNVNTNSYNNPSQYPQQDPNMIADQQRAVLQQQMEQVYQYVEDRGVSRTDSRIRYDVLVDTKLTNEQRKQAFYDSVEAARSTNSGATTQQQQPSQGTTQRPPSDTVNPPVDGGGRSSGSSGSRQDADLNLYLTNEISRDEFLKRQPNFRR